MFLAVALPTCLQVISYAVRGHRWKKPTTNDQPIGERKQNRMGVIQSMEPIKG